MGTSWLTAGPGPDGRPPQFLFTENETNTHLLFGAENQTPYVKDAFHEFLIRGRADAVNPAQTGTKAAALYQLEIPAGKEVCLRLRLVTQAQIVGQASRLPRASRPRSWQHRRTPRRAGETPAHYLDG